MAGGVQQAINHAMMPIDSQAQLVETIKVPLRGAEVGFGSLIGKSTDVHRGSTPARRNIEILSVAGALTVCDRTDSKSCIQSSHKHTDTKGSIVPDSV